MLAMSAEKPSKPETIDKQTIPEIQAEAPAPVTPENQEVTIAPDPMQAERQLAADAAELAAVHERLGIPTADNARIDKIKAYEKANGVNQDVIAQSYLAHADIYKNLSEKRDAAMNRYFLLEKSNAPDHPSVIEAKREWDDAVAQNENEFSIMNPMLENLMPETLEKYRKDFELRGAINPN